MRTDERYFEDITEEGGGLKYDWKSKNIESTVKQKQVNCSFKMFLLLSVWYREGGESRGNQKQDGNPSVCLCVSVKLSQLKSWQSVEAREQSEES